MYTRKYIMLKVTSPYDGELREFIDLCRVIQFLGAIGASRLIPVAVDGDGSARLRFEIDGKELESLAVDIKDSTLPKMYIGE